MNYYEIGYHSYEEAPQIILISDKEYSQQEFKQLCAQVTVDIYNNRKQLFKDQYAAIEEDKDAFDGYDPKGRFEYLLHDVVDKLISDHAFRRLEIKAEFSPFGWAYFIPKDDWKQDGIGNKDDIELIRNLL